MFLITRSQWYVTNITRNTMSHAYLSSRSTYGMKRSKVIQSGREISAILLIVVGDGWKHQKNVYTKWGLNLIVYSEKGVSCSCSRRTACIVRDNAKKFTSVGLSYKGVILFSKIFYMFDIVSHFMRIFGSERCGNAVTKANGSSWLHKLKVDALSVQSSATRLSLFSFVRSFKLK